MSPARYEFPLHLLNALLYFVNVDKDKHTDPHETKILQEIAAEIQNGIKLNLMDFTPHPVLLLPEFYRSNLRDLFGQWALVWLKQQKSVSEGVRKASDAGLDVDNVSSLLVRLTLVSCAWTTS